MSDIADIANDYAEQMLSATLSQHAAMASTLPSRPDCIECGEDIPQERQAAVAGVQHCVGCADLIDRKTRGARRG